MTLQFVSFDEYMRPVFKAVPKKDILYPYLSPSLNLQENEENGYDPLENPLSGIAMATRLIFKLNNILEGTKKKRKLSDIY